MRLLRMIGRHLAGNLVAYLALLIATSGTAYAVATVDSDDVVNNSLQSTDLMDDAAVKSVDVRDDTLAGGGLKGVDIAPNTLTGADVNESTLGKVPNADRLDGLDSSAFEPGQTLSTFGPTEVNGAQVTVFTSGPFELIAVCPSFGDPEGPSLNVRSSAGPWSYAAQSHQYTGSEGDFGAVGLSPGLTELLIGAGAGVVSIPASGYAAVHDGMQITFNVYLRAQPGSEGQAVCTFGGYVVEG